MDDSYYADGSVVQVGDTVEIDLGATHHSYSGWVSEMDQLAGIELTVVGIKKQIAGYDKRVAILHVAPLDDDAEAKRILNTWAFQATCSFFPRSVMSTWRTQQNLLSFLRGCERGRIHYCTLCRRF